MKVGFDTNILIYAEGYGDARRIALAKQAIAGLLGRIVLPGQVLGEFYNVLARKSGLDRFEIMRRIEAWRPIGTVVGTTPSSMLRALQLATDHRLQVWDAVVMVAAVEAGCAMLLSEDMQDGFLWNGLTIVNPFATPTHPFLSAALAARP
ncbi:PIN domain-containing protein [Prosthecodimorpha staleyi]|uniref:PIN domain-containing protein n=1 Tax=Prosthecodimorpha staleyi TaxID=2840188 RepID=A0A947DCP7_9HYPH|nr:PIN domain-containing protein [Prosthecodimorpha staleyi]MBT9292469.1 PIN domain-containing protein [Prosthecodimorpha staleyi]